MKRMGFTLAEVLITLGIIGVVAALTAPALVQNAGTAKVGPTLAKVVSTLELANEQILKDEEATKLSSVAESIDEYMEFLSKYISGSSYNTDKLSYKSFTPELTIYDKSSTWGMNGGREFKYSDGISIILGNKDSVDYEHKGSFKGQYSCMFIDINGINTKPNSIGRDVFIFYMDDSGQVVVPGSNTYAWLMNNETFKYSSSGSPFTCNEKEVLIGFGCAGSIFENNLKVIYQ